MSSYSINGNPSPAQQIAQLQGSKWINLAMALLVIVVTFVVHLLSPVVQYGDSRFMIPVSSSIVREGNIDLDEIRDKIEQEPVFAAVHTVEINGHYYNPYPLGPSLLALPVVWLYERLTGGNQDPYGYRYALEHVTAALIVTMTAFIMFLIARLKLPSWQALLVTFVFAFCTAAWSIASRALWQHGPSMLMLSIALLLLLLAERRPRRIQYVGAMLVLAYLMRPSNALSFVAITLYVFFKYRPYFIKYLLWALLAILPFFWLNLSLFGTLLPTYYQNQVFSFEFFGEALIGQLISPARGLFIYSPVLLLSIAGIVIKWRTRSLTALDAVLLGVIGLHWIAISLFKDWTGGYGFGPRYFSDMVPYFVYFTIPAFRWIFAQRSKLAISIAALLIIISFWINMRGATRQQTLGFAFTIPGDPESAEGVTPWNNWQFLH